MSSPLLELREVSYYYPDKTPALKNISIKIIRGERIAVLGGNGAGKSTLFLLCNGVYKVSQGELIFQGKKINYSRADLLNLRKHTGIVFQDPETQIFSASVREEISFGLMNLGFAEEEVTSKVDRVLEQLSITHLKNKPTHFLSYGEKKKVCIADILVMDPDIFILDEPDACLDPAAVKNLMGLIHDLHEADKTIIMSTQDVNLAYSWADRILVLKDGMILKDGAPSEIFSDPQTIAGAFLEKPLLFEIAESLKIQNEFPGTVIYKHDLIEFLRDKLK